MEARKGRAKIRSEPLPPSSPPSPFQHRDTDINYRSARNGAFFQACGEVAAVLPLPPRSSRVKEVNTRGASSVHRIVSLASCVRPINLPVLSSSSSPPCTRNRARFVRAVYAAAPTSDKSAADTINESYYGASKTTY